MIINKTKIYKNEPSHFSGKFFTDTLKSLVFWSATSLKENMTKEEYLEWVRIWKSRYSTVSEDIRLLKSIVRMYGPELGKHTNTPDEVRARRQHELTLLKAHARALLALRRVSKIYSEESYQRGLQGK